MIILFLDKDAEIVPKHYDFLVCDYMTDGFEGSGYAIAKKNNNIYLFDLSHSSCRHPFDKEFIFSLTVEEFINKNYGDKFNECNASLMVKVFDLISQV